MDHPAAERIGSAGEAARVLVTGATGLLGSHLAERLDAEGDHVRALVRPESRTDFLDALGVEIVRGDLTDPACVRAPPSPASSSSSTAPRRSVIGEGGTSFKPAAWTRRRRSRGQPCAAGVDRFLHISSTSAYGHPARSGERRLMRRRHWDKNVWVLDYYTRSKVECERLLWRMAETGSLPLDGHPPELALWRARPHDRPAADPGISPGADDDRGQGRQSFECRLRRSCRRRGHPCRARSGLAWRGVQHHQPGPHHPARVSRPVCRCPRGSAGYAGTFRTRLPLRAVSCSSFGIGCSCARGLLGSPVTAHGCWAVISNTARRKLARGWDGSRRSATPRASSARSAGFETRRRTRRPGRRAAEPVF